MEVKELIERLEKMNPEDEVYISQDDHYFTHLKAHSCKSISMAIENDKGIIDDDVNVVVIEHT